FMVGRDKEKSDVLATVLNTTQANIAILGAGGIGKTTLALFILHDPQVVDKYHLRYFVSCEAVSSLVVLLGEIANVLRIPWERRDEHLYDTVLTALQKEVAILCLDNLETVWDTTAHREEIEGFLSQIGSIPVLTLLVTMRGTQRPSGVFWSKPLLSPLTELDLDGSKEMFEKMFQPVDEFVDRLLRDMDGIPLAILLIASLLQEGNESSKSLWMRWEKAHTKVVELGGRGRMSNLDASIHLSLYSPRMMADKLAIHILAMLSLLPDGFPDAGIKDLQNHLSADIDLSKLVQTLKRVSLVYTDQAMDSNQSRLHILSPVRYFCEDNIKILQGLRSSLMSFYIQMLSNNADWSDHTSHMIVPPELLNIYSVFLQAWKAGQAEESLVVASVLYTQWSLYIGNPVEEIIMEAIKMMTEAPKLLGSCFKCLSDVDKYCNNLEKAELHLKDALELDKEAQDALGQANDLKSLGDLYLRQDKLDEAQLVLKDALELHKQAHSVLGQANDLKSLGDLYLRQDKLDEAQLVLKDALELHKQAHSVLGQANDLKSLGDLYLRQDKLDEAQLVLKDALELHKQAQDVLGQANDLNSLGDLYLQQDKLDEAQLVLKDALELHKQAQDVLGQADDLNSLGDLYLRQDKLDEAQLVLKDALELHKQAHSVLGQADDLNSLGDLYLRQDKLDEAQLVLKDALELHKQAQNAHAQANDLQRLRDLYLQQDKMDKAETLLKDAL
ncbi:TPR-like protein, partial [Tricholoma matsutake]